MRLNSLFGRLAPVAVLATIAAACGNDSTGSETARVSLAITDHPGDIDSVWVQIEEIYLQGSGGQATLLSAADAAGLGLIELTQLAGTALDLVHDVTIDAGSYGQLRFVISGAVLETEDGNVYAFNATHPHGAATTGTLNCPSCTKTGIKVLLQGSDGDLDAGSHVIVLDFDVSQSFGQAAGMSGMWVMHPVIQAADLGFTGSVTGTVDVERDASNNPLVTIPECPAGTPRDITMFIPEAVAQNLTDDNGPIAVTSSVESDGSFSFPYLHPDQYDLTFIPDVNYQGGTLDVQATAPGIIDVTSGGSFVVEYTITGVTCL